MFCRYICIWYLKNILQTRNALSWEQTARFQQFNVQRNSAYVYFWSDDLAQCKDLVTTIDDYSNLYVQNLTFYFYDLELDPMTLVLKLDLDMVVTD